MKKVYANITARLIIRVDEGEDIDELISNMDYDFRCHEQDNADIEDMEIRDVEITDVK